MRATGRAGAGAARNILAWLRDQHVTLPRRNPTILAQEALERRRACPRFLTKKGGRRATIALAGQSIADCRPLPKPRPPHWPNSGAPQGWCAMPVAAKSTAVFHLDRVIKTWYAILTPAVIAPKELLYAP
ncbi:hypothetical protein [Rhizobium sp. SGZ-381]|uniref:hypothetical protein n=1 Tax=Rhizobium sp. SGZ-381 TaxID=3342800 RepID=UPI003672889A